MLTVNNFVINVGSVNGSGSQSSNSVLVKSLFRMGLPVAGKNLFPSNIAGLPTWFNIRINEDGYLSRKSQNDIVVAMNAATFVKDMDSLKAGGVFIYNSDLKVPGLHIREDVQSFALPCRELISTVTDSIKLKKFLTNMLYVGVLAELLKIDHDILTNAIRDLFANKDSVVSANQKAVDAAIAYAKENYTQKEFPYKVQTIEGGNEGKILVDGNSSGAMGLLFGGCTFMSWYPITPSSSLAEGFISYSQKYRKDASGKNRVSVLQAEDELSAISMVLGASWAGARAVTATSGPGISLMGEAAGLSYFAEVPAVIWNVERAGPSTGLPTRTMQGDLSSCYKLSHGDTQHIVLIPGNPEECFEFGQTCFDLAEKLQTLVFVLSDLDLGMNLWISDEFKYPSLSYDRGKVLDQKALENLKTDYKRYQDVDGDGICYRTLPGTRHEKASFFTRGTSHDEAAQYSEDNDNYKQLLNRLSLKHKTARSLVPKPIVDINKSAQVGVILYGTTSQTIVETQHELKKRDIETSVLRVRALPLCEEVFDFIRKYKKIFIVEQNRDAQLKEIILNEFPEAWQKLESICQYDGLPIEASFVTQSLLERV